IDPRGWCIDLGRRLHVEGLVRAFAIEFADEGIEPGLLLQEVHARRTGGLLLEGSMHALVLAVLVRTTRLDPLDRDAEAQPPDGQPGQIVEPIGRCEGEAIVASYRGWQTAIGEETSEEFNDG